MVVILNFRQKVEMNDNILCQVKGSKLRNGQAQEDWPESYTSLIDLTISALKLHYYCKVAKLC